MKNFSSIDFQPRIALQQLSEFQQLLQSSSSLSERDILLPFFRERLHLAASVGLYHTQIIKPDLIAFEYDIFGDFASDLVVGDSVSKAYCFVELEDAGQNSIFVSRSGRNTPEWSPRFERGCSQIVDWFWKLDDFERTDDFENRFNSRSIDYIGLLIIGRDENLALRERKRLDWRSKKMLVNSLHINSITFDRLHDDLFRSLSQYEFILRGNN